MIDVSINNLASSLPFYTSFILSYLGFLNIVLISNPVKSSIVFDDFCEYSSITQSSQLIFPQSMSFGAIPR